MDPNVMEAKVAVSLCGHDRLFGVAGVKRIKIIGMIEEVPGMKDMNTAEDAIVRLTREIVPRMIVTIMEVVETDGAPRTVSNLTSKIQELSLIN